MPNYCSYCLRIRAPGGPCEHCGAIRLPPPPPSLAASRETARMLRRGVDLHVTAANTIERLCDRVEALEEQLSACIEGLQAVGELIAESEGVAGLHMNGDTAPWRELREGGGFEEWLMQFDAAMNAVVTKARAK